MAILTRGSLNINDLMAVFGHEVQVTNLIFASQKIPHGAARPPVQLVIRRRIRVGIRVCAALGVTSISSSSFCLFLLFFVVVAERRPSRAGEAIARTSSGHACQFTIPYLVSSKRMSFGRDVHVSPRQRDGRRPPNSSSSPCDINMCLQGRCQRPWRSNLRRSTQAALEDDPSKVCLQYKADSASAQRLRWFSAGCASAAV